MKRLFAALAFLMAFTFVGARGQNATDEKTRWQSDVEQFAATITAGAPIGDCAVVASDATLRTFGQTQPGPIAQLSNLTKQSRLVSARSGTNPMISLASDLALDAKSIELDSTIAQHLTISEERRRSSDSIAARWLATELGAQIDDPVALVVLFRSNDDGTEPQMHFVLVKGRNEGDGKIVITHAVHATLDQLLK